jgi:gluconolactonase
MARSSTRRTTLSSPPTALSGSPTRPTPEQEKHNVFRVDGKTGDITVVVDDFAQPNGILLSPDEEKLYVVDTDAKHIRVFDVDIETGGLSNDKTFADDFYGDGMRCDVDGNIWCSVGYGDPREDGVRCYASDGALLGKIHLPEWVTNLTFGALRGTACTSAASARFMLVMSIHAVLLPVDLRS